MTAVFSPKPSNGKTWAMCAIHPVRLAPGYSLINRADSSTFIQWDERDQEIRYTAMPAGHAGRRDAGLRS